MNPFMKWVSGIVINFLMKEFSKTLVDAVKSQEGKDISGSEKAENVWEIVSQQAGKNGKTILRRFFNYALEAAVYKYAN